MATEELSDEEFRAVADAACHLYLKMGLDDLIEIIRCGQQEELDHCAYTRVRMLIPDEWI